MSVLNVADKGLQDVVAAVEVQNSILKLTLELGLGPGDAGVLSEDIVFYWHVVVARGAIIIFIVRQSSTSNSSRAIRNLRSVDRDLVRDFDL